VHLEALTATKIYLQSKLGHFVPQRIKTKEFPERAQPHQFSGGRRARLVFGVKMIGISEPFHQLNSPFPIICAPALYQDWFVALCGSHNPTIAYSTVEAELEIALSD
jgi:hypothetical protein